MTEQKSGLVVSGECIKIEKSPKGFIVFLLVDAKVFRFFSNDGNKYKKGMNVSVTVSGSDKDTWLGFDQSDN